MNDREWVVQDRLINRAYDKCEEEKKREEDEETDEVVGRKVKNGTQQPHVTRGPTSPVRTAFLAPSQRIGGALPSIKFQLQHLRPALFFPSSYQTPQPRSPASRRSKCGRSHVGRDSFSDGSGCSTYTTLQLDTGLKPFSFSRQSVQREFGLTVRFCAFFLFVAFADPPKTARKLVCTTTNCLPLCSLYAQDGQLFLYRSCGRAKPGSRQPVQSTLLV